LNDRLLAAREARETGHTAAALAMLLSAAQHFPEAPAVRHDLARLAEDEGDWPEAERWNEIARAKWPDAQDLVHAEAHLARARGQWTRSLPLYEALLELNPNSAPYRLACDNVRQHIADLPAEP
jgi:tetratricopeptide (TPR) repeat protein